MVGENVSGQGSETANFKITGLCSCEFKIIEKKMKNLEGVDSFSLNPVTNQLKVTFNRSVLSVEEIQKAVSKAGGKASLMKSNQIL